MSGGRCSFLYRLLAIQVENELWAGAIKLGFPLARNHERVQLIPFDVAEGDPTLESLCNQFGHLCSPDGWGRFHIIWRLARLMSTRKYASHIYSPRSITAWRHFCLDGPCLRD